MLAALEGIEYEGIKLAPNLIILLLQHPQAKNYLIISYSGI